MRLRVFLFVIGLLALLAGCVKHVEEVENIEQTNVVDGGILPAEYVSAQRNGAGELISLVFRSADTLRTRISVTATATPEYRINFAVGDTVWLCAVGADNRFTGENYPFCCSVFSQYADSARFDITTDATHTRTSMPNGSYLAYHFPGGNAPRLIKPRQGDASFELNYGSSRIHSIQLSYTGVDFFGKPAATQLRNNYLLLSGRLAFAGTDLPRAVALHSPMGFVEFRIYPAADATAAVKGYWVNGFSISTPYNTRSPGVLLTSVTGDGTTPNPVFASVLKLDTYGNVDQTASLWSDSLALSISSVNTFTAASYNYMGGKTAANPVTLSTVTCQRPSFAAAPAGSFHYKVGLATSNVVLGPDMIYATGDYSPADKSQLIFPGGRVAVVALEIRDAVTEALPVTTLNINTEADLLALQNSGSHTGDVINLNCDVDFTASGSISDANPWRPIAKDGEPFAGIFNGNGHTIKGLVSGRKDFTGDIGSFFGPAAYASVSGLTIDHARVYAENVVHPNGSYNNCIFFGGGDIMGNVTITDCRITNSEIHPVTSNGGGQDDNGGAGNGRYHAGFVGAVKMGAVTITGCTVDNLKIIPEMSPTPQTPPSSINVNFSGGMVGAVSGAGAKVVIKNSTVNDCAIQAGQLACGGFVGGIDTGGNVTIDNCTLTGSAAGLCTLTMTGSARSGTGGFIGQINKNITNSTTIITNSRVTGYVTMKGASSATAVGGCGGVLGLCGNDSETLAGTCNIIIDNCQVVGAGVNLTSNANTVIGGIVGNSKLCNGVVIIKNCSNSGTITVPVANAVHLQGGIVGQNQSPKTLVFGSKSSAVINLGTIAQMRLGGIIGNNQGGYVIACYSEGPITTASANALATNTIGGIAGANSGTVMACYRSGEVAVTSVAGNATLNMGIIAGVSGYWDGSASPATFVLAKSAAKSTVQDCYWVTGSYALKNGPNALTAVGAIGVTNIANITTGIASDKAFAATAWPTAAMTGWGTAPSVLSTFEAVYPIWGANGPWKAGYNTYSASACPKLVWE